MIKNMIINKILSIKHNKSKKGIKRLALEMGALNNEEEKAEVINRMNKDIEFYIENAISDDDPLLALISAQQTTLFLMMQFDLDAKDLPAFKKLNTRLNNMAKAQKFDVPAFLESFNKANPNMWK